MAAGKSWDSAVGVQDGPSRMAEHSLAVFPSMVVLMGFTCPFIVFTLTLTALSNKTLFVVQDNLLICVQVKDFPST